MMSATPNMTEIIRKLKSRDPKQLNNALGHIDEIRDGLTALRAGDSAYDCRLKMLRDLIGRLAVLSRCPNEDIRYAAVRGLTHCRCAWRSWVENDVLVSVCLSRVVDDVPRVRYAAVRLLNGLRLCLSEEEQVALHARLCGMFDVMENPMKRKSIGLALKKLHCLGLEMMLAERGLKITSESGHTLD